MGGAEAEAGEHRFVVDHLEGELVVGELEGGGRVDLPRWLLPSAVTSGDVVAFVRVTAPSGERAFRIRIDGEATRTRRDEAVRRLDRLRRRDPGGDLDL